jgi:predicted nuclease of predicted toxin-antitoxin system
MNLSPDWVPLLAGGGHEALHWRDLGAANTPDTEIMAWAREHGYVVFTHDLDFGALLHATGAVAPSVIQFREDDVRPEILGSQALLALGPVKIKMAGWREEEMRCRTRRERGSVVTALQDRKSNADPAHQQPSPLGCRSFAAMLCCPRESRPQGYCLSYAPRLAAKLLAPPPAF